MIESAQHDVVRSQGQDNRTSSNKPESDILSRVDEPNQDKMQANIHQWDAHVALFHLATVDKLIYHGLGLLSALYWVKMAKYSFNSAVNVFN